MISIVDLPPLNAIFNGISAVFLTLGIPVHPFKTDPATSNLYADGVCEFHTVSDLVFDLSLSHGFKVLSGTGLDSLCII